MNTIKHIEIKGLLRKYYLEWDLYPDVNILVGINGSGKTTILRCVDALLLRKYSLLKNLGIGIRMELSNGISLSYGFDKSNETACIEHEYITTFDVPLKDKRSFSKDETPLDKELKDVIYTLGNNQKSFSGYRLKATNFPDRANEINRKIGELFNLINSLFFEKEIEINKEDNTLVFRQDESIITLEQLSSGEKHLLVILFTVFLMEGKHSILLMDEPEISLHIDWQQQLIDVIRSLNPNTQLLIATHSPSVFGEGWGDRLFFTEDLTVLPLC